MTLTAVSGSVVPRLTIVAPISILGTPQLTESDTASSTRRSAPFTSTAIDPDDDHEEHGNVCLRDDRGYQCFHAGLVPEIDRLVKGPPPVGAKRR